MGDGLAAVGMTALGIERDDGVESRKPEYIGNAVKASLRKLGTRGGSRPARTRKEGERKVRGHSPRFDRERLTTRAPWLPKCAISFYHTNKENQYMKTKLDTMNSFQRAIFARKLYGNFRLKRTATAAVNAWTIKREGK